MENKDYTNSGVSADFIYDDADDYQNEIAELYSYSEENDSRLNFSAFQIEVEISNLSPFEWRAWSYTNQFSFTMKIIDHLENSNEQIRMHALRCVLYLVQGCWMEARTVEEQQEVTRKNIQLLFKAGVFPSTLALLNIELEKEPDIEKPDVVVAAETDEELLQFDRSESIWLKLILNVLYTMVETIRCEQLKKNREYDSIIEECVSEISSPLSDGVILPIKLLNMANKFCDGTGANFPIKKILLLLWKCSLMILGSADKLLALKNDRRAKNGLECVDDDTVEASKSMQPSIVSGEDNNIPKRTNNTIKRNRMIWRLLYESGIKKPPESTERYKDLSWSNEVEQAEISEPSTKDDCLTRDLTQSSHNLLFFKPKVRERDIEIFLHKARRKYFGYKLKNDNQTVIGLPVPVQESVQALRRHLYVSLSDKHIEEEKRLRKYPYREEIIEQNPTEVLYHALLPNFRKYITDLLRIMLASSPSAKLTSGNLNSRVVADMLPKSADDTTILPVSTQSDIVRHKEIIVKAITATLLIYLKHFKTNHIYQFEFMCQLLAQSSFIKLTLQVFTPVIPEYVAMQTTIPRREFPSFLLNLSEDEYMTEDIFDTSSIADPTYTWRNLFSSINLMRILNKLVKWKTSRILNMVSLKSHETLKEILQIQQPLLQIYVLKLLKMQTRYLGRYWRRNNLKVMTAIYTKVRHRFNDDWAYGCDTVARFWNAQEEEMDLRMSVMCFHNRRYPNSTLDSDSNLVCSSSSNGSFSSSKSSKRRKIDDNKSNTSTTELADISDESLTGNLREQWTTNLFDTDIEKEMPNEIELTKYFKENYEEWLKNQVYNQKFDWDSV